MSSCLSGGGGGRPYGFDLEIVKSSRSSPPRPNSHNTSSPTSTISESSNSPLSISTRKPRTPRKRPNQTYNEAAALLSGMYPTIFPTNCHHKFTKFPIDFFSDESESSNLFLPFRETRSFDGPRFQFEPKLSISGEVAHSKKPADLSVEDDFDAESILDEETEEGGIDSIMGSSRDSADESAGGGLRFGLNWKLRLGIGGGRGSIRAWKRVEEMNYWWNFPTVDVLEISPKLRPPISESAEEKKAPKKKTTSKGKKKAEKLKSLSELRNPEPPKQELENPIQPNAAAEKSELMLKLNYDAVLDAWSGNSPFSDEGPSSGTAAASSGDVSARLAQIDLFSECDIVREASVMRYKEKRRTRLFSKKIRYQVRKANADQRPRMKGRFVRRPNNSSPNDR